MITIWSALDSSLLIRDGPVDIGEISIFIIAPVSRSGERRQILAVVGSALGALCKPSSTIALVSNWQGDATQPLKGLKMRQINRQMTWIIVLKDRCTAVVSEFSE